MTSEKLDPPAAEHRIHYGIFFRKILFWVGVGLVVAIPFFLVILPALSGSGSFPTSNPTTTDHFSPTVVKPAAVVPISIHNGLYKDGAEKKYLYSAPLISLATTFFHLPLPEVSLAAMYNMYFKGDFVFAGHEEAILSNLSEVVDSGKTDEVIFALRLRADVLRSRGDLEEARESLFEYADRHAKNETRGEDPSVAKEKCDAMFGREVLWQTRRVIRLEKDYLFAGFLLEKLMARSEAFRPAALNLFGDISIALGDKEAARAYFSSVIEDGSDQRETAEATERKARLEYNGNNTEAAIRILDHYLEDDGNTACRDELLFQKGVYLMRKPKHMAEAVRSFNTVIDRNIDAEYVRKSQAALKYMRDHPPLATKEKSLTLLIF